MTLSCSPPYTVREAFIGTLKHRRERFLFPQECFITVPVFAFYLDDEVRNAAPIRKPGPLVIPS